MINNVFSLFHCKNTNVMDGGGGGRGGGGGCGVGRGRGGVGGDF